MGEWLAAAIALLHGRHDALPASTSGTTERATTAFVMGSLVCHHVSERAGDADHQKCIHEHFYKREQGGGGRDASDARP